MPQIFGMALIFLSLSYGAFAGRQIKALSEEEIRQLGEGHGMGLALAAELNHYPGPKHVLELADRLQLTDAQRAAVQKEHDRMKSAAVALGQEIVALERELDGAFAAASIDEKRLLSLTGAIAERQGRPRYVHLSAHLATRAALSASQIERYDAARGYVSGDQHHKHRQHH